MTGTCEWDDLRADFEQHLRWKNKVLHEVCRAVVAGFTYDPGHSDLDDEQPINVRMKLGDWRKANRVQEQGK